MKNFQFFSRFKNVWFVAVIMFCTLTSKVLCAQEIKLQDTGKKPGITMTSFAFGGTGVLLSKVKGQSTIMTGGRGSATFNNRYTFGGGGWGMLKGVELHSNEPGVYNFFKFGYGGLEFGYIFYPGEKIRVGSNLLLAYGAGFNETVPKSSGGDFKMFPVAEPSVYIQISLGKYLKLDTGITYRYVTGSDFAYINNHELSGMSFYIALLTSSCKCD
jgi:hypothetical protein